MFSCDPKQASVGISRLPWQAVDTPQVQHFIFPVFEGDIGGPIEFLELSSYKYLAPDTPRLGVWAAAWSKKIFFFF